MNKYLLALAGSAAIVSAAQAQSSVSIYGAMDASLQHIHNAARTDGKLEHLTIGYVDSAITSSAWGVRGVEHFGNGYKATFNFESDIQTNNGGMNHNGLFRRAANVGIGGNFGQIDLGLKQNPLIAAHNALMPVAGNSVAGSTAYALDYKDDFTKNAITYTSPNLGGLIAQLQYGLQNTVGIKNEGAVFAANSTYTGIKDLTLRAAFQRRFSGSKTVEQFGAANTGPVDSATGEINKNGIDKMSYLFGGSYKFKQFTLAAAWLHNQLNSNGALNAKVASVNGINAGQFGVGYQATPNVLLGASYTVTTADSSLINAQVRYSFSKRSTLYTQLGYAMNGNGKNNQGAAIGNFAPVATNSGELPSTVISGYNGKTGLANTNVMAFGVGMIHIF